MPIVFMRLAHVGDHLPFESWALWKAPPITGFRTRLCMTTNFITVSWLNSCSGNTRQKYGRAGVAPGVQTTGPPGDHLWAPSPITCWVHPSALPPR